MEQHGTIIRECRKGNWTVEETMILIEAKKKDEERRMKRSGGDSSSCSKPGELRWKWIEEYCWNRGCLRNQNQCNDKWDNLMRDYKRVRDYESKRGEGSDEGSYWKLERHERKERHLPSNMLREIYEALVEVVVERRSTQRLSSGSGDGGGGFLSYHVMEGVGNSGQFSFLPPLHHQASDPPPPLQPLPSLFQSLPTLDSETTEYPDSPAKRRKTRMGTTSTSSEEGSGITRSATTIAEAIQSCEEQEERRHREHLSLQERRLKMEEMKNEIDKQGISGLVYAINGLASSIFDLASEKTPRG